MSRLNDEKPYQRALLLSGGGTRLALYGGMFEALEKHGLKPDIFIASCGGAFASVVINTFATHDQRKAFFQLKEYFNFVAHIQLTYHRKLHKLAWYAYKKTFDKRKAPIIEDIFETYLVEMSQDLSKQLPSLATTSFHQASPTVMIGSKILFSQEEVGQKRGQQKLFQKVLLTDETTAQKMDFNQQILKSQNYQQSAVMEDVAIKTTLSMLQAARMSMADMFYMAPMKEKEENFLGGVVDLVPIELGFSLAKNVILERKQGYTRIEEGLIRAVFGFSANARLDEINQYQVKHWIDTRDASVALRGFYPQKNINWKAFEVSLSLPSSYEKFQEDIQKQWQYGYEKTLESIQR